MIVVNIMSDPVAAKPHEHNWDAANNCRCGAALEDDGRVSYPVPVDPAEVPHWIPPIAPDPSWPPPPPPTVSPDSDPWLDRKLIDEGYQGFTEERQRWGTAVQITAIICMTFLMAIIIIILLAPR